MQAQLKFGPRAPKLELVKSFSFNERTILKGIFRLHCPEGFELDPTYGKGNIYGDLLGPKLKYDLEPSGPEIKKADCRDLPFKDNTIKNIVFDPPFLGGGGKTGIVTTSLVKSDTVRQHSEEVYAFLLKYYGTDQNPRLRKPLHTITTKDRFALVMVNGTHYQLSDIGMRMLAPRELFRANGFPDSYIIDRDIEGNSFTKAAQVALCGNSVPPDLSEALVEANVIQGGPP